MGDRFLALSEVEQRINRKSSTIYNLMRSGRFPKKYKFGWLESEIDQFIKDECEHERNAVSTLKQRFNALKKGHP